MRPLSVVRATYDPTALFEPDVILSVQAQRQPGRPCEPEHRLMEAVLEMALHDLRKVTWIGNQAPYRRTVQEGRVMTPREKARAYILNEDRDWIFSFENCCEHLGIHPEAFRRKLEMKGLL